MKHQKILALLLAVVMSAGCLAGCGQKTSGNEVESSNNVSESKTEVSESSVEVSQEEPSLFNTDGSLPIVNEPITLKVLTQDPANVPYDKAADALLWEVLEEKTGIHFEVESYPVEELKQKLPLIMATPEEMPDLFIRCDMTAADILSYGTNGQLLMMDDYIEQYANNIKECIDTLDYAYGAMATADGHIYSLPSFNGDAAHNKYGYNVKFLEAVNMEEPTTIEELYDVFKAVMALEDPDGDGVKNNHWCISDTMSHFRSTVLCWVGINNYWPVSGCMFDEKDDEVYFVPTSDAYKYMLGWLNKMYEEGMIDPETFTQANSAYNEKMKAGRLFMVKQANDTRDWESTFSKPISSAISEPFVQTGAPYQTDIGAISAYTEYPEVCVLLFDYLFSEEGTTLAGFGQQGIDYTVSPDNVWAPTEGTSLTAGYTSFLTPKWVREYPNTKMEPKLAAYVALRDEYGEMAFQDYLKFTDEEAETINFISADLGLYTDDYFIGFITGEYDLEKDWDAYVEKCNSMKLEELTKVYQSGYNRYFGLE